MNPFKKWTIFVLFFSLSTSASEEPKPKYGPQAVPLSQSHAFLEKKDAAPGFWRLIPYYVPQQDDKSCSIASVVMIMNAARAHLKLNASDRLVTQADLLKKVNSPIWNKGLGFMGRGINLEELGLLIEKSFKAYGIQPTQVEVIHTNNLSENDLKTLQEALKSATHSKNHFVIANFLQSLFTGDAPVGHFAPLTAYDAENKKVLVLDPDRDWYEPYWVSEQTLIYGMTTTDKMAKKHRGYIHITLSE